MDQNGCDINRGIVCDVHNCHYHTEDRGCTADKIQVGPQYAASSSDTVCSTFRPE